MATKAAGKFKVDQQEYLRNLFLVWWASLSQTLAKECKLLRGRSHFAPSPIHTTWSKFDAYGNISIRSSYFFESFFLTKSTFWLKNFCNWELFCQIFLGPTIFVLGSGNKFYILILLPKNNIGIFYHFSSEFWKYFQFVISYRNPIERIDEIWNVQYSNCRISRSCFLVPKHSDNFFSNKRFILTKKFSTKKFPDQIPNFLDQILF